MSYEQVGKLIDRWINDPGFKNELRRDPEGAVKKAGVQLTAGELAALKQIDWKLSDSELQAKISKGM